MQRSVLITCFLAAAFTVSCIAHAQNQPSPDSDSDINADYPADRAGVFIQSTRWMLVANQTPVRTRAKHGIAASLSYGAVPAKVVAEYEGERAPTRTEILQPVLCICHILSLPGDPVLVKLHPKKGIRELDGGRMIVYPVVGNSKMIDASKSDLIPADVSHPDSSVWLVRPKSSLEPGEYALMLGTQNMSIYAFRVVPASAHPDGGK